MRILIAPDRFSGTATAVQAAHALADGWAQGAPGDTVTGLPLSDGSAGLLDVVADARGGRLVPVPASGPLGSPVAAAVLHVPGSAGGTVYVEADQVLGTHLVRSHERADAARRGTSTGLGALLAAALATGARRIVVGLPATAASHDGGAGLLHALATAAGAEPGESATPLTEGAAGLGALGPDVAALLGRAREALAGHDVVLAVADDLPLLGLHGAGAVLGQDPAVGAALAQELERALGHATDLLERHAAALPARTLLTVAGTPSAAGRAARQEGSGAAGGSAFLLRLLGARALPGAEVVADAIGLRAAVGEADLVVTGGRVLDARSLTESVVATVARAALVHALPVVVVAEEVRTSRREVAPLAISGTYEVHDGGRRRPGGASTPVGAHADDDGAPTALPAALVARAARLARTWSA
ncbi:glycerate kinase [Georgenia sp. EYE_87]|uniref:glycerate kinase n=1 Tax=Georgenia sp. EYE_87 TaxID=2853448 RepID=UPI0020055F4A|nr:glycerate kinase [Georgenia sp. EYE_87]MCK6209346.1 glycerate kinase [Georgenia sp. EYE_87]